MKTLQTIGGEIAQEYPEGMGFTSEDLGNYLAGVGHCYKDCYYRDLPEKEYETDDIARSLMQTKLIDKEFFHLEPRLDYSENLATTSSNVRVKYNKLPEPEPIEDETKIPIAQKVIQKGLEVVQLNATEQELHNYKGIPPFKVVNAMAQAWRSGKFDKMVVVDVEEKKIELPQATKPLVIDPLFACKNSEHPDRYYLLAGWLEDISLAEFVQELALGGRTVNEVIQLLPKNVKT